jgi:hypothetical protein
MRDLIRNILKEYVKKDIITLEEISLPKSFFNSLIIEGKSTVSIPKGLENELISHISKKFNWPPNINQKWCSDIKEKEDFEKRIVKYSCNKKFSFLLSKHWLQRLFRSEEPDYKEGGKWFKKTITDPTPTEGIDLFFNSKEKINDFIDNESNWLPTQRKFILLSKNDYQTIISLNKEKKGEFVAEFVTQIKGERFFDTPELRKTTYL